MNKIIGFLEDDDVIRENYAEMLSDAGFTVRAHATRQAAMRAFEKDPPDLALLDVSIGKERDAGFQLCMDLRRLFPLMPVVFLTSHDGEVNKISGLRLGADDYITKDASIDYIIVRLEALFRRIEVLSTREQSPPHRSRTSSLTLDSECSQAYWKGAKIDLSLTQYWMLLSLASEPGKIRTHRDLMKAANMVVEPNTIVAHVKAIRDYIKRVDGSFDCIKTERGMGYRWVETAKDPS